MLEAMTEAVIAIGFLMIWSGSACLIGSVLVPFFRDGFLPFNLNRQRRRLPNCPQSKRTLHPLHAR